MTEPSIHKREVGREQDWDSDQITQGTTRELPRAMHDS